MKAELLPRSATKFSNERNAIAIARVSEDSGVPQSIPGNSPTEIRPQLCAPDAAIDQNSPCSENEIAPESSDEMNVFVQFDDYMKSKKNKVTPGMMKVYNNTKGLLKAFEVFRNKPITFDCFDFNFYDAFVDFLTNDYEQRRRKIIIKGLKQNSIGKTVKHLRVFLRDRARRKIIAPIDLSDFKILSEDADAIYLTPAEIERIYHAELPQDSSLEYYRDLLVLGCQTGLRFKAISGYLFLHTVNSAESHLERFLQKQDYKY